jgi:hypothetical protein
LGDLDFGSGEDCGSRIKWLMDLLAEEWIAFSRSRGAAIERRYSPSRSPTVRKGRAASSCLRMLRSQYTKKEKPFLTVGLLLGEPPKQNHPARMDWVIERAAWLRDQLDVLWLGDFHINQRVNIGEA